MDPVDFLRQHEPFSRLGEEALERAGRALEIAYVPRGMTILARGGEPNRFLWIVGKGAVRLEVDGRSLDVLAAGEPFGFPSLMARSSPQFDVVALEDCLLYRLPEEVFKVLLGEQPFEEFFVAGLADRLRRATQRQPASLAGDLSTEVGRLIGGPPAFVDRAATVGDAARVMRERRIGSVLVRGEPMGIVTDRDLRSRVLAEGLGPDVPVDRVMTAPVTSCPADAPLYEALLILLSARIHHLPLIREGEVIGVVSHTDVLRHHVKSPGYLLKRIDTIASPAELEGYAAEIAGMVEALAWSGVEAVDIGHVVASLNDAVAQQILRWVERELGPPPCAYRWIVFGSEGRREQTLLTDQDNALVYADEGPEAKEYFARFAEQAVAGLIRASFPPCRGGFMATHWNRSLDEWDRLFRRWTEQPEPQALLEACNFFDFRGIHGDLDLEPLERRVIEGGRRPIFLAQLVKTSLGMRPPLGLFHRIREGKEGVDLKAGGLMPIIALARVHGLEAGTRERSTVRRLAVGREAGTLSEEGADTLAEAFRFLFRLRLGAQLEHMRRGEAPDNNVRLDDLGALERRHLKDTFLHVRTMQEALSQRFGADLLG